MAVYEFEGKCPDISESAYIHPSASVIGNVDIGPQCFIGPGAVIRADFGKVCIGIGCAVEDNCVIHVEPDSTLIMGNNVLVGHGAIVHGPCIIHDKTIIGMGSILSTGCEIGPFSLLAAGSVILQGQKITEGTMAAGNPASIKKPLDKNLMIYVEKATVLYSQLAGRYQKSLRLTDNPR